MKQLNNNANQKNFGLNKKTSITDFKFRKKLFEERYNGNVPDSIFKKLMFDYEQEQNLLQSNIADRKNALAKLENLCNNVSCWADTIGQYTTIERLTLPMLVELIDVSQYPRDMSKTVRSNKES